MTETKKLFSHRPDIKRRNYIYLKKKETVKENKEIADSIVNMLTAVILLIICVICFTC